MSKPSTSPNLISMKEVADFLGVSPVAVRRLLGAYSVDRAAKNDSRISGITVLDLLHNGVNYSSDRETTAVRRNSIGVNQRQRIKLRDQFQCRYCGRTPKRIEIDHILPVSKGGKNIDANLVACCEPCNRRKHRNTAQEAGMKIRPCANGDETLNDIQERLARGQMYAQYLAEGIVN